MREVLRMIEMIKNNHYTDYEIGNGQKTKVNKEDLDKEAVAADIKAILNRLQDYTYSEQDIEAIDEKTVDKIKGYFDVSEEDVYELYAQGIDLEQLTSGEVAYRKECRVSEHRLEEEHVKDKKEQEEKKSLKDKIEVVKQESNGMYVNMLLSRSDVTINNLYANNFKGEPKKGIMDYTKEDVGNVLKMNGIEENKSSLWAADLLMMYDLGVNKANILSLQNMKSAVGALNILETGNVDGDKSLVSEEGVNYQKDYIEKIKEDLYSVTDEEIEELIEEGEEISIDTLRQSIHKNADEVLHKEVGAKKESAFFEENSNGQSESQKSEQIDAVKKQILQITAKLTAEAAQKISGQMPLESSSLAAVSDMLHQMEMDMMTEALTAVGAEVSPENIELLADTMAVKENIDTYFMETVQIELRTDQTATLNEIEIALARYMENETPVERRFGENLAKVEDQIEGLLERNGIAVTPAHVEAAKALVANGLEVSDQNIDNVEEIVLKVNGLLQELTPQVAARMIKEGINPYHSTIDQIMSYIGDQKVQGLQTSVAEAIVAMEESGQISEAQKEGLVGLYRILQGVTNDKAAVMGYLFKNELPITLENLQIATKYVKANKGISVTVDDQFGERESLHYSSKTSRQMIEESLKESRTVEENIKILENLELPITDENLSKLSKMSAVMYPYIKEQFKRSLGTFEGLNSLPESFLEKMNAVQNVDAQLVEKMMQKEMPLTLNNIYWMDKITKDPALYGALLDENGMLKDELPSDLDELENELLRLEASAKKTKEESVLSGDFEKYKQCKQIEEMVQTQKQRIEKEGLYQIPFMIEGERKLVNLYLYDDQEKQARQSDETHLKAMITYETKRLGKVKAYIEIKNDQLGFKIEEEKTGHTKALKAHEQSLLEGLKKLGYQVNYTEFVGASHEHTTDTVAKNEAADTTEGHFETLI